MFLNSNSVRVLFVLHALYRNGAVELIIDLADALTRIGVEVEILALEHHTPCCRLPKEAVKVNVALREGQHYRRELIPALLTGLTRSAGRADMVVLTWEMGPALKWASRVAYFLCKPTIAIIQNNIKKSTLDSQGNDEPHIRRWAYKQARAVVCVSQELIPTVEPEANREKITAIANGIDIERVRALAQLPGPPELPLDERPFIVGLGRLSPQKGFDLLIQAHAAVLQNGLDHRLVLVGEGTEKSALLKLCQDCGVADSVVFLGYSKNPYPVLTQASLFCLSSRYEGRPLSLMEACVLGVPVVATDCLTGPRGILEDGQYGDLVKTESVDALSEAIARHLHNPQRLRAKAQASADLAERFSMQNCAKKYHELISNFVSSS